MLRSSLHGLRDTLSAHKAIAMSCRPERQLPAASSANPSPGESTLSAGVGRRINHHVELGFDLSDLGFRQRLEFYKERRIVLANTCPLDHGVSRIRRVVLDERLRRQDPAPVQIHGAMN